MRYNSTLLALCCSLVPCSLAPSRVGAATLAEKREQLTRSLDGESERQDLRELHETLAQQRRSLESLYRELQDAVSIPCGDTQTAVSALSQDQMTLVEGFRQKIVDIKKQIRASERAWKASVGEEGDGEFEGLWHQPDSTIGQLVIDYSSGDSVFIMSPDIAGFKIHLSSRLSVPKASWSEMLDVILASFGIGIKPLSPFVKQLYFIKAHQSSVRTISDERSFLDVLAPEERIAFICSPPAADLRRIMQFLDRFIPQEQVSVQAIGGHIILIGSVREIKDLMKVYDFITAPQRAQEYRIVSLKRADSEEVAKMLGAIFDGEGGKPSGDRSHPALLPLDNGCGFRVVALKCPASSLFLMGKRDQIEKACAIIQDLEKSIGEVQEKGIHWYSCRHSEAEDLAKVLSQVYTRMLGTAATGEKNDKEPAKIPDSMTIAREKIQAREHAEDSLIVDVPPISISASKTTDTRLISENFVVDPKTNSIIMVVENYIYPRLKELLQKLDVPKRMVQIDVLMFQKSVSDSSSMGLSHLKMGDAASKKSKDGLVWTDELHQRSRKKHKHGGKDHHGDRDGGPGIRGILDFFLSRKRSGWFPAYDLAYQFLLTQEDIQINANPSVTTVNQTPAKIAVVEQISVNTGAVEFDRDHVKDSYSRAEYGITIQITPTVHAKIDEEGSDEPKYVTLQTDIVFDSIRPDQHERPDVTRRNVKNEVRVRDGETVILGGLRRKLSSGQQQMIPFLGELPGLGKLFSMSSLSDSHTEMFIFLTPKILPDDHEEWRTARLKELMKRPGDTPEFLQEVLEARHSTKEMLMAKSLRMLMGKPDISS